MMTKPCPGSGTSKLARNEQGKFLKDQSWVQSYLLVLLKASAQRMCIKFDNDTQLGEGRIDLHLDKLNQTCIVSDEVSCLLVTTYAIHV